MTTLTPGMRNLFATKSEASAKSLRSLIEGCLKNGDSKTACTLADCLLQLEDADISDVILFGRSFFAAGEYNRSLAVLEHEGLLSAQRIAEASELLLPSSSDVSSNNDLLSDDMKVRLLGLSAIRLAATCLLALEQHEDCVNLIEPVLMLDTLDPSTYDSSHDDNVAEAHRLFSAMNDHGICDGINIVASMYCMAGKCYDLLENRGKAKVSLIAALKVDPACTEALNYLISNCLVSLPERKALFDSISASFGDNREWLKVYHRFQLLDEFSIYKADDDSQSRGKSQGHGHEQSGKDASSGVVAREEKRGEEQLDFDMTSGGGNAHDSSIVMSTASKTKLHYNNKDGGGGGSSSSSRAFSSAMVLVRKAEKFFDRSYFSDAYRLARQAYIVDPFDEDGLVVYIGSMVELGLKTELFYLSHELINTSSKKASSWYVFCSMLFLLFLTLLPIYFCLSAYFDTT
jgi:hypothetical protein